MTHQNLHLEKCWKLFLATLNSGSIIVYNLDLLAPLILGIACFILTLSTYFALDLALSFA